MKGRTRILVTHSMAYVDYADKIVMMKHTSTHDCYTVKVGTAASLRADDEQFRTMMETYNRGRKESECTKNDVDNDGDGKTIDADELGSPDRRVEELQHSDEKSIKVAADTTITNKPDGSVDGAGATDDQQPAATLVEVEEREIGQVTWAVYKYYIAAGGSILLYFALSLTFCAAQALQTSSDFWLADWSNSLTGNGGSLSGVTHSTGYWLGAYGALALGTLLSMTTRTYCVSVLNARASRRLHHDLLHSILRRSVSWFDRTPTGRIINRFTRDLGTIDMGLAMFLEFAVASVLSVIGTVVVIAIIVPITLAVFVPLVPLLLVTAWYYRMSSIELRRLESVTRSPVFVHFSETLIGCATIRALSAQQLYLDELCNRMDVNARSFYYTRVTGSWLKVRLDLIAAVIVGTSTVLAVGCQHAGLFSLSPGALGLLVSYALSVAQLLTQIVQASSTAANKMNSVERVKAYSAHTNHEQWETTNQPLSQSIQGGHWPSKGRVQLKGLQLRYRPDLDLVLRDVDVDIVGGSRVGIVGRTGSGKSSLLVALFRLVEPCGGDVLVDGVPLSELSLEDVRSHLTILPQEAVLFAGSLRYNLDPFGQQRDEQLWAALQTVQLEPLVRRMPQQLDSEVTECGVVLSAGQKQLLCLARALLRHPKVLCLDEATANVDLATDEVIQRVIRQQLRATNTTLITIAHRINTVLDFDKIIVMDKGRVAEYGTPDELRKKEGGIFASMLTGRH